jgi:hypothetical protein
MLVPACVALDDLDQVSALGINQRVSLDPTYYRIFLNPPHEVVHFGTEKSPYRDHKRARGPFSATPLARGALCRFSDPRVGGNATPPRSGRIKTAGVHAIADEVIE